MAPASLPLSLPRAPGAPLPPPASPGTSVAACSHLAAPSRGTWRRRGPSVALAGRQGGRWRAGVSSFLFLPSFFTGNKGEKDAEKAMRLKEELLAAIAPLDRGAEATPEDKERVEQIVQQLEAVNQVKEPLKSDLLNGKWELLYTTSTSILQPQRPKYLRPFGKIYQAINADTLRAQNMETCPYFNQVTANLVPLNPRRVAVQFDYFKIFSLISIKSPGSGKGELEITYLDEELRYRCSVLLPATCESILPNLDHEDSMEFNSPHDDNKIKNLISFTADAISPLPTE
ncbi:putative plastid-lipid-associated protein 4, chloroplastic [Panicum miliaceum]|uniref:Plastid-lipid-associated protein 4, chloroplastic n=1 Tax=Panicum miliaceum TaxID=4540 RepID=A0A3L6SHB4_PANMI|nr:putative plastid-lipid-associated protein 4, chloroplastic [Panicum miliaceum]